MRDYKPYCMLDILDVAAENANCQKRFVKKDI